MKKKVLIIGIILIVISLFSFFLFFNNNKSDEKSINDLLKEKGYSDSEVSLILDKVSKDDYDYVLEFGYDKSLINILSSSEYDENKFTDYIKYYMKNKDSNINDIIAIINSDYDLDNYPASSLLASLVKEKYYINDNVARYLDYGNNHDVDFKKVIGIVNSKADLGFYSESLDSNLNDNNLILVNKFYHLKEDYIPSDLVSLGGQYNRGANSRMRKEAADAFMKMVDAAKLDNIILYNASAFRSYDYQVNLYNRYIKRDGKEAADKYSARPGYSEHQSGLCSDLNEISDKFDGTDEANWLKDNAYKYGFILRFPKGKEDITGYKYEPWHYRYVGLDAAKIIHDDDITLEEYYAYYIEKISD